MTTTELTITTKCRGLDAGECIRRSSTGRVICNPDPSYDLPTGEDQAFVIAARRGAFQVREQRQVDFLLAF